MNFLFYFSSVLQVKKVKGFTTLFDLHDDDWNLDVEIVVKAFFLNKSAEVLSIYFADVTLTASLGFPTVPVKDMTYFLKDSADVITPENFYEVITFGTTNDNIEGTMLSVLEHVYAPVFFNETSWPDSILYF
jgi:dynein heavy chain